MINYTGNPRFPAHLTITSAEAGNMVQANLAQLAMTAPGSEPATPNPGPFTGSHLPGPVPSNVTGGVPDPLPVGHPKRAGEQAQPPSGGLGWQGHWTAADGRPGPWRDVAGAAPGGVAHEPRRPPQVGYEWTGPHSAQANLGVPVIRPARG